MQAHQVHQLSLVRLPPLQTQKEKQKQRANKAVHKPQNPMKRINVVPRLNH